MRVYSLVLLTPVSPLKDLVVAKVIPPLAADKSKAAAFKIIVPISGKK
jgi:hypothetical protein